MHKVRSSIFGFLNEDMETGMLLRHMITRGPRLIEYITVERISPLIRNKTLKARPTSGALMLVVAAGLQPERLVIAGIDLYLHPFGAYPGDTVSDNNYAQVHDVDTDLAVIKAAVDSYKGELIIFSDELRKKLKGNKD
jgi:hypothetical protein